MGFVATYACYVGSATLIVLQNLFDCVLSLIVYCLSKYRIV